MKNKTEEITPKLNAGRCANCGGLTFRYSVTHKWYICVLCSSVEVLKNIADHVTNPNDI